MPIGTGAVYAQANLPTDPGNYIWAGMPIGDEDKIIMHPTAPLTTIAYSNAGWTGKDRCLPTGGVLLKAPIPTNYVIPNGGANNSAAILGADGRTVMQMQPLTRCTAGGDATAIVAFPNVDLYGDGIRGAHGGSGMSSLGGTIRRGELRPGQKGMHHALKVGVYAKQALYQCTQKSDCYRWPAVTADNYAVGWYGSVGGNSNTAMKMGALLAIPASKDLSTLGLETEPAKQLAWTLQNYGAYIVDDSHGPQFQIGIEDGPDGALRDQFKADWGFPFFQYVGNNTPWTRDMQRLVQALYVVNNNSPTTIGGGGTPRQPLAPQLP